MAVGPFGGGLQRSLQCKLAVALQHLPSRDPAIPPGVGPGTDTDSGPKLTGYGITTFYWINCLSPCSSILASFDVCVFLCVCTYLLPLGKLSSIIHLLTTVCVSARGCLTDLVVWQHLSPTVGSHYQPGDDDPLSKPLRNTLFSRLTPVPSISGSPGGRCRGRVIGQKFIRE